MRMGIWGSARRPGVLRRLARRVARAVWPGRDGFDFIAADLTDTCHLRCTFCGNDFSVGTSRTLMDETTFRSIVPLMELVDDGQMMLSCRFEPFLHPRFLDMVETVPVSLRKRAFFTTSLALPITDDALDRIADLGLHHVNVSVDSLRAETFESIRRRAKFERFRENLERLRSRFAGGVAATELWFITVAVRENAGEIPGIVETCLGELGGVRHEVRYVFPAGHLDAAWRREHLLADGRWAELRERLRGFGDRVRLEEPPAGYFAEERAAYSRGWGDDVGREPGGGGGGGPVALIVFADGTVRVHSRPDLEYRLAELEDPVGFLRARARELRGGGGRNLIDRGRSNGAG